MMMHRNIFQEIRVEAGYGHWAAQYDQEENALIRLKERLTSPMLEAAQIHIVHFNSLLHSSPKRRM